MSPLETVERYVELFNAGRYAEMGELFAPESVWRPPPPTPEARGREAIREGYGSPERAVHMRELQLSAKRYLVDGKVVVAEFVFEGTGSSTEVVDVFDVDDEGRITCMTAYSR